jgi:hypothetical protein
MLGILTGALKVLPLIVNAISSAEKLTEARGHEKKVYAMDLVSDGLKVAEGASGKDLLADDQVRDCTSKVIDAVVALFRVLESRERAGTSDASNTSS